MDPNDPPNSTTDPGFMELEREITRLRLDLLDACIKQIQGLDEHAHWALLVARARQAGLAKEDICRELSCAWSTVTRWIAGRTSPGPAARTAIKAKLLRMLATSTNELAPNRRKGLRDA